MATIAFLAKQLNLRGTGVAIYDYAEGCEDLLGHRAVVLYLENEPHDSPAIERFRSRFELLPCRDATDIDRGLEKARADIVHVLKLNGRDKWTARAAPTAVHQVFATWAEDAHGDRYAYVSRWLARASGGRNAPWVPHVVALPPPDGHLRTELQIPAESLVLGCHGGPGSFDLQIAKRALTRALESRRDLYFVGLNLTPFLSHERARFLPGTADPVRKRRFVDTCDAMLHARRRGETFGLAVAEFSLCNRPVLTWSGSNERAHLDMLGDAALKYRSERHLFRLLTNLDRRALAHREWDRYSSEYASAPVMARFDDTFLRGSRDPAELRAAFVGPDEFSFSGIARYMRRIRRRLRGKSP